MKFDSNKIVGLFNNESDNVGSTIRNISMAAKIVVAQGFGVPDDSPPVRFLAYIVPVLHLLKQLPKSATAEFYFAIEGTRRANHSHPALDKVQDYLPTLRSMRRMKQAVLRYVAQVHPQLLPQIRVLDDLMCEYEPNGFEPLNELINSLLQKARELCSTRPSVANFVEKRGGEPALRYMVEHALYMRDPLQCLVGRDWLLVPEMDLDMEHLIMVGGPSEGIFYQVREWLCAEMGIHDRWRSHQLWTPIGNPPTYHRQPGEPRWGTDMFTVDHVLECYRNTQTKINERIIRDFLILLGDAAGVSDFRLMFLVRDIVNGKKLNTDTMDWLQRGWQILRTL